MIIINIKNTDTNTFKQLEPSEYLFLSIVTYFLSKINI